MQIQELVSGVIYAVTTTDAKVLAKDVSYENICICKHTVYHGIFFYYIFV
jgi:hypothetical protein